MNNLRTIDMTFAAMFVALMAIGANLGLIIPDIGGVPLTLQTFFAILAGLLLGSRLGAISMTVYALVGLVGVPVYAKLGSGIDSFVGANGYTGGFIISFIFVAFFAGLIVEKSKSKNLVTFIIAAFVGAIVNYGIGTPYMVFALNTWAGIELSHMAGWISMAPFAVKDAIFTLLAALIAPRLYEVLIRTSAYQKLNNQNKAA
jgi:biotin transport system substrate-specific component